MSLNQKHLPHSGKVHFLANLSRRHRKHPIASERYRRISGEYLVVQVTSMYPKEKNGS